ncbi:MAG: hypothetical protein ACK56L_09605 [Pseudanabaena sp.]|jgi:hypothetical protein
MAIALHTSSIVIGFHSLPKLTQADDHISQKSMTRTAISLHSKSAIASAKNQKPEWRSPILKMRIYRQYFGWSE